MIIPNIWENENYIRTIMYRYGWFQSHGGTQIARWFISWKNLFKWMTRGYAHLRKPPYGKMMNNEIDIILQDLTIATLGHCSKKQPTMSWNSERSRMKHRCLECSCFSKPRKLSSMGTSEKGFQWYEQPPVEMVAVHVTTRSNLSELTVKHPYGCYPLVIKHGWLGELM